MKYLYWKLVILDLKANSSEKGPSYSNVCGLRRCQLRGDYDTFPRELQDDYSLTEVGSVDKGVLGVA